MIRPKDVIGSNARIIERKRLLGRRLVSSSVRTLIGLGLSKLIGYIDR